ncbi:MAG: hypothetical protein AABY22_17190 [Nanoarchaeota archaeon]
MKRIFCFFNHHEYFIIRRFEGFASAKVGCKNCHKVWAMSDEVKAFVPWSLEFQDMYESFGFKNV